MTQIAELIKMLLDAIKLLLEEPGRLKKAFLSLCKVLLTLIFTEWAYRYFFGNYRVIDFSSFEQWKEYLLSGRFFICIGFLLGGYIILFHLLPMVSYLPFALVNQLIPKKIKIDKGEGRIIFWILRKGKMLDVEADSGRIKAMEHTEDFSQMMEIMISKEARSEINDFKNTLIYDLGHTYFVFAFLFFTVLPSLRHNPLLNKIVVIVFIMIVIAYLATSMAFEVLHVISSDLVVITRVALTELYAEKALKEMGITLGYPTEGKRRFIRTFSANGKSYYLSCIPETIAIDASLINQAVKMGKDSGRIILLLIDKPVLAEAALLISENSAAVKVISYSDREDLLVKTQLFLTT